MERNTKQRLISWFVFNFRARRDYWENLKPASGRPDCPLVSKPDSWGVTQGDKDLLQKKEETTDAELKDLFKK